MNYASLWRRFAALLLDSVIFAIPFFSAAHVLPLVGGIVVWFFYAPVFESSAARATPGKFLLGIQVVSVDGSTLSVKTATVRNLLKLFISSGLLFLGYAFALFTQKKQTLHDLLAETVVIRETKSAALGTSWTTNVRKLFKS